MRKVFIKHDPRQFIEGQDAWANNKPLSSNPYDIAAQPVFYTRWRLGWLDCQKVLSEAYSEDNRGDYY